MDNSSKMSQMEEVEHKLNNSWVLWVHFPQDSDWTPKSYKNICRMDTVEQIISIIHLLPEDLVKNCKKYG